MNFKDANTFVTFHQWAFSENKERNRLDKTFKGTVIYGGGSNVTRKDTNH